MTGYLKYSSSYDIIDRLLAWQLYTPQPETLSSSYTGSLGRIMVQTNRLLIRGSLIQCMFLLALSRQKASYVLNEMLHHKKAYYMVESSWYMLLRLSTCKSIEEVYMPGIRLGKK